jgi:L-ribulose-5-phosphate 4-epimerase
MLKELKERVFQANLDLVKHGLVLFTWGNVSAINRKRGLIVIKPSGVDYANMKSSDMAVVDMDGKLVEGLKPSSDMLTHLEIYKAFPEVGGITHTHSTYATSWAQAGREIPFYGTTHADYFYGAIPCVDALTKEEVEKDYERNTGLAIVRRIKNIYQWEKYQGKAPCPGDAKLDIHCKVLRPIDREADFPVGIDPLITPAVLVKSHGMFSFGHDADNAVHNAVVCEQVAKMAHLTEQLNPQIKPAEQYLLDKHYNRKHGKDAYYGQ